MRSCVLLLLMLTAGLSHSNPDGEPSKNLRLLEFVMLNDAGWQPVIGPMIKITADDERPPYHGHETDPVIRRKLSLIDDQVTIISPATVIRRVLNEFPWLGSYVNYAARLLGTALACFTHMNVSRLMGLIVSMEYERIRIAEQGIADGDPGTADPFRDTWTTLKVFADKMAGVNGDLNALADVLYAYADVMLTGNLVGMSVVRLMSDEMDRFVVDRCYWTTGITREYLNSVFGVADDRRPGDPENVRQVINRLLTVYDDLNVETMPMDNWQQALNFKIPLDKGIKFRLKIDKTINDDPLGRKIVKETVRSEKKIREDYAMEKITNPYRYDSL